VPATLDIKHNCDIFTVSKHYPVSWKCINKYGFSFP